MLNSTVNGAYRQSLFEEVYGQEASLAIDHAFLISMNIRFML